MQASDRRRCFLARASKISLYGGRSRLLSEMIHIGILGSISSRRVSQRAGTPHGHPPAGEHHCPERSTLGPHPGPVGSRGVESGRIGPESTSQAFGSPEPQFSSFPEFQSAQKPGQGTAMPALSGNWETGKLICGPQPTPEGRRGCLLCSSDFCFCYDDVCYTVGTQSAASNTGRHHAMCHDRKYNQRFV